MEKIDFIVTWVDGSDPAWQKERSRCQGVDTNAVEDIDGNAECRYRENGLLRYWFRSVEKYAPWVNKVHFVTCGQRPEWLNETHPKLHLVNHEDYIPQEYLPTFNSNAIELNFHRIEDLSEHFVLFNDDMFILRSLSPSFYFRKGCPVLLSSLEYYKNVGSNTWCRVIFNDYCIVNHSFNISKSIWENRMKWFNIKELGYKKARKNLCCYLVNRTLPVGIYGHVPLPHLKSTLQELWECHPDVMHQTSMHKFRTDDQVNQWLMCAWNQAKGDFYPSSVDKLGRVILVSPTKLDDICGIIESKTIPQICVNDSYHNTEPERCMREIARSFETLLPEKSSFEKF